MHIYIYIYVNSTQQNSKEPPNDKTQQKQCNRAAISSALAAASGLERPFRAQAPETYTNRLETNGNLGIDIL